MRASQLFSAISLLASRAAGAVLETRNTCVTKDINFVNSHTEHSVFFCDFFLAYPRTTSPFVLLSASNTWNACQCISAAAAAPRSYRSVTVPDSGSACSAYTKILSDEYNNPSAFCTFYTGAGRTRSTIPGLTVGDVQKACSCLTSSSTTTSSAATSTTITTSTIIKAASTKTTTCSNNALRTAAANFVSGLAHWTATASPTANATVSSSKSNSYDSSGSSALLTCTYARDSDAHADICSERLSVCGGQNYTVSLKYKFLSRSIGSPGVLGLYNYGWDTMLDSFSGPRTSEGKDGNGVAMGSWGSVSEVFEAVRDGDQICVLLQCLSSRILVGQSAQVVVDKVNVVRVA